MQRDRQEGERKKQGATGQEKEELGEQSREGGGERGQVMKSTDKQGQTN